MLYRVVFVEDEIVTREGIRDNVDWVGNGFEFAGEASDGEMALQLLRTEKPDVLITDIKMPFMDGLQLCKIVRERMPAVQIVILSGHDEFEYAQKAINLGVKEYLLKPVTVSDLHQVLQKLSVQIAKERADQAKLQLLQDQVQENQAILKERFMLKLVLGAMSSSEAIEKGQMMDLDLMAREYLVVILKARLTDRSDSFDYDEYRQIQQIIADQVENNPDVFLLKKDWEEFILLMKGNTSEYLEEERDFLLGRINQEVKRTRYHLMIGVGQPKNRISQIYKSFIEAAVDIQNASNEIKANPNCVIDKSEMLKVDRSAVEDYLKSGTRKDFDEFFDAFIRPLGAAALKSYLIKNYILVDVILTTARFLHDLGSDIDQVVDEFNSIETILMSINTIEQLKEQVKKILLSALDFRNNLTSSHHLGMIKKIKEFIEQNYMDPDLSLNDVAAKANLSPSHFSVIFSQEVNQTFKEYLTEIRIKKAKELLRSTALGATEISCRIGYSDPHYFSYVFKKNTNLSPTEFRAQTQFENDSSQVAIST
jgi:two-component system, response regulator YesN